ncbi:DUF2813 domain-containing protein [Paenibacillus chitinolyticus]|uniref:DUF2813 domain-containing protein n=1 Tax=Paenibacillus chitinolyticus TaxID=79263 RepID=UPI0035DEECEF
MVLVGDNNIGKSTILESIDLVLGPERLSKHHVIDEHDFYADEYLNEDGNEREIHIEAVVVGFDHTVINVDKRDTKSIRFLERVGLDIYIEQFEMEKDLS